MSRSATPDPESSSDVREAVAAGLERLREECPTNYDYLVCQWSEVREGVEQTAKNYPSAKQIHGAINDPESTPRTIGPALKALESLKVIGLWSESVGANRNDLTEYDRSLSAALDELLEEQ